MLSFETLLAQGTGHAWLFIPSAILLGALHGLEPGHSKTMMAAFIIAIKGTVTQAVLLGLAATISHTAVVWGVALIGQSLGARFHAEGIEASFQIASGMIILGIALWMIWHTWHERHHHHDHDHEHHHDHHHEHAHAHDDHDHPHVEETGLLKGEFVDAHERAHALEIEQRFANRTVTTPQIVMFGLTGGLIPCPASITILMVCLQLKAFALGAVLVGCFSLGLALTMVGVGVAAALSVRHVSTRWAGFNTLAAKAPYVSGLIISLVGVYTLILGWLSLGHHG